MHAAPCGTARRNRGKSAHAVARHLIAMACTAGIAVLWKMKDPGVSRENTPRMRRSLRTRAGMGTRKRRDQMKMPEEKYPSLGFMIHGAGLPYLRESSSCFSFQLSYVSVTTNEGDEK